MTQTIMDEVTQIVGFDACMRLVASWGGSTLYIPADMTTGHPIAAAIGPDLASRLSEQFGNEVLAVPKCEYSNLRRNRQVRMLNQKGLSVRQISQVLNLSERQVQRVLADVDG